MSATKKVIDTTDGVVDDATQGLLMSDSFLAAVSGVSNVVVRNDIEVVKPLKSLLKSLSSSL